MRNNGHIFIDVSHVVEHGMITYKGLPAPIICDYLSREASKVHYAEGTTFQIGKIPVSPLRAREGSGRANFVVSRSS
jgi:kynurenine formamidase